MIEIKIQHLQAICPRLSATDAQTWANALNPAAKLFDINHNADRLAMWLAQMAHESAAFTRGRESTKYKSVKRMREVFRRLDKYTDAQLQPYVSQPQRFANFIYANLLGNGPEASGDGWAYRGGGPIGLTGRAQYRDFGRMIAHPLEIKPELIEQPAIGALTAAAFWHMKGLNKVVDALEGQSELERVTRIINGGWNGLADRQEYLRRADAVLK